MFYFLFRGLSWRCLGSMGLRDFNYVVRTLLLYTLKSRLEKNQKMPELILGRITTRQQQSPPRDVRDQGRRHEWNEKISWLAGPLVIFQFSMSLWFKGIMHLERLVHQLISDISRPSPPSAWCIILWGVVLYCMELFPSSRTFPGSLEPSPDKNADYS